MPGALFLDLDGTLTYTHALRTAASVKVFWPHGVGVDVDFHTNELLDVPGEFGKAAAGFIFGAFADPGVSERLDR